MPKVSKAVLAWRNRQREGTVMKPGTFKEIERKAAAGGATNPQKVAGAAYWKTARAKYRRRKRASK